MSNDTWSDEYKFKVRKFMEQYGSAVRFEEDAWRNTGSGNNVSIYGWHDYDAVRHIYPWEKNKAGCSWIVPEGAELTEESYTQFAGTFTDCDNEVGVNVSGCHCACGQYTDVTLRWTGTVTDMLHSILELPDARLSITL